MLAFVASLVVMVPGSSRPALAQEATTAAEAEAPKDTAPSAEPLPDDVAAAAAPDSEKSAASSPPESGEQPDAVQADDEKKAETPPPDSAAAATKDEAHEQLEDEVRGLDSTGTPEAPTREGEQRDTGSKEELPNGEKRQVPDYDGRPEPSTDAGDVVRWVPKVVLYPVWFVAEFGLRIPIVWTVTRVEENYVADRVFDFFTWDDGRAYFLPNMSIDFGVRANLGFVFNWKEVLPRNDVAMSFLVGLNDYWSGSFKLDQKFFRDEDAWLRWQASYNRKPDAVFFSVSDPTGRCEGEDKGCRYRTAIADASLGMVGWESFLNTVTFQTGFRHARFSNENSDSPALTDEQEDEIPGFDDGYQIIEPRLTFALDTRDEDLNFSLGTGVRFEGDTAFAIDVNDPDSRWFRAGGELIGYWDLGFGQVLGSSIYYEGLVNVSQQLEGTDERPAVPFYELPFMGGNDQMRGFLERRLIGHNALAYKFEYTYPISWGADATIFTSIGNTFEDWSEWNIAKNYLVYGLALRLASNRVTSFEALIGWGSNRLDSDVFEPFDQFRCSIGVHRGF